MKVLQFIFLIVLRLHVNSGFRFLNSGQTTDTNFTYFRPFDGGFVGTYGEPSNFQRERINEGAFQTQTQELLFEGPSPRQVCPSMVGPFSDGSFYCTAKEYGYCDTRSGTCFCNIGYQGIDCSECQPTHFLIGNLCYPKVLCPNDCSGAGSCNYYNGTCNCFPHREGTSCEVLRCSTFNHLCISCDETQCLQCQPGYYLTLDERVCGSCYNFDPRCAGCTREEGCTLCADPLLTSVRRSGYRSSDPRLPIEEDSRELSITLPMGTKDPDAFAEAEDFMVVGGTLDPPLNDSTITCSQGLRDDNTWDCEQYKTSNIVCGHYGVFQLSYPNFIVPESDPFFRLSVRRSGGGYGNVRISYHIQHFTTNDSDVSATAPYTTSTTLYFGPGVVERTFLVSIMDDHIVEEDEVFQVVLETPIGGGSLGPQFRANVTIIDNDLFALSPIFTRPSQDTVAAVAGEEFNVTVQAAIAYKAEKMTMGGERFFAVIENYQDAWDAAATQQRNAPRRTCNVTDNADGTYTVTGNVAEQGKYQLRIWHAFNGSLIGDYFKDAFFMNLALERNDRVVNFTWGTGPLIPRYSNYISVRWSGAVLPPSTDTYYFRLETDDLARIWIDGSLLLDHWDQELAGSEPPRPVFLQGGRLAEIVVEFLETNGEAQAYLLWGTSSGNMTVITSDCLFALYEIGDTPVEVTVLSADTSANTSECSGAGMLGGAVLGSNSFSVCPRDRFRNMRDDADPVFLSTELFAAELYLVDDLGYDGAGAEIVTPARGYDADNHCFLFEYTVQRAGAYLLHVYYQSWHGEAKQSVTGSPFLLTFTPEKTLGPTSRVYNLPKPLYLDAGTCHNFTVVARDYSKNLMLKGGDQFQVYMYRVDFYSEGAGNLEPVHLKPTPHPTAAPSASPTSWESNKYYQTAPAPETIEAVVRYGIVRDLGNGNYTATICPVVAGKYEIHVLYQGFGVSNQPFSIMDKFHSYSSVTGEGSYRGEFVDQSPYTLVVSNGAASAYTSRAYGEGLVGATVGMPVTFVVTVRDAWDNVLRTISSGNYPANVTATLDRSPHVNASVWNYRNGSFLVEYTPAVSGPNLLTVKVNGGQIYGSPFLVQVDQHETSSEYSYAQGKGLHVGTANEPSYFEVFARGIDNVQRATTDDMFVFTVQSAFLKNGVVHLNTSSHEKSNNINGTVTACPASPDPTHPACSTLISSSSYDSTADVGHYYGVFTPLVSGTVVIHIYLKKAASSTAGNLEELANSPFIALIAPTDAVAEQSIVRGDIYNCVAGEEALVAVQLRDRLGNYLDSGGALLQLAILGVGVEWGTILPSGTTPGLPNQYHYRGFDADFPRYDGVWTDNNDGTYTGSYSPLEAGEYVLRVAVAEAGLNATYFNTTTFGYLSDGDSNDAVLQAQALGLPVNPGSSVSWTGDVGRRPGLRGNLAEGTYYHRFLSRSEPLIDFDLRHGIRQGNNQPNWTSWTSGSAYAGELQLDMNETMTVFTGSEPTADGPLFKFREQFWSARWTGMITPLYAEPYTFSVKVDSASDVVLRVGGEGAGYDERNPGALIVNITAAGPVSPSGLYNFTDLSPREIVLEYVHYTDDAYLSLLWQSPSTPLSVVPHSAFLHWRNATHYNLTTHPNTLSAKDSTVYGEGVFNATVGVPQQFVVYGRDVYGNLRQTGGDVPSMVAVGPDGVTFRGDITDYKNSTYLIEYYPVAAGQYSMYVTIGCCPPHPNVGVSTEIATFAKDNLLVSGRPFLLTVIPAAPSLPETIAMGDGLLSSTAGGLSSFKCLYRDLFKNPTYDQSSSSSGSGINVTVTFIDKTSGDEIALGSDAVSVAFADDRSGFTVTYNLTRSGEYLMYVRAIQAAGGSDTVGVAVQIAGSPFAITVSPGAAWPATTVCRGAYLRQQAVQGRSYSFEIEARDIHNNLLTVGGSKFFVRISGGDVAVSDDSDSDANYAPICADHLNGKYSCTYTASTTGLHHINVMLLSTSSDNAASDSVGGGGVSVYPGGSGLVGNYYSFSDPLDPSSSSLPVVTTIEKSMTFSWPNGIIFPASATATATATATSTSSVTQTNISYNSNSSTGPLAVEGLSTILGGRLPFSMGGQSVLWRGYLVSPRSDKFSIFARTNHFNATIYIDSSLVFDSVTKQQSTIQLVAEASYLIVIVGRSTLSEPTTPLTSALSFSLMWSTPTIKPSLVSSFFLYPFARHVAQSPYPVEVGGV